MTKVKFSNHAITDREERIVWLATAVGFGEVVDEILIHDEARGSRRVSLTTTGVAIIKSATEELIITMYCPTVRQITCWYGGNKNIIPIHLLNVAKRNEKRGWTNKF